MSAETDNGVDRSIQIPGKNPMQCLEEFVEGVVVFLTY